MTSYTKSNPTVIFSRSFRTGTTLRPPPVRPVRHRSAALRHLRVPTLTLSAALLPWGLAGALSVTAAAASHHAPPPHLPLVAVPAGVIDGKTLVSADQPFTLTKWDTGIETLRNRAHWKYPGWSAVMMDNTTLYLACRDGLVKRFPPDAKKPPASPCGIPAGEETIVMAWDRSRAGAAASDWSAFWDIARHPGKRGLRQDPRTTLEIALLADGVAPDDIYATLSTPEGVARAFRKLDQLRPYIVWWKTPGDAGRIMATGSALMTSAPADEVLGLDDKTGFVALWHQNLIQNLSWAILRNVPPRPEEKIMAILHDQAPHHEEQAELGAPGAQNLTIDDAFWADHLESMQKRFESWLKQDR